MTKKQPWEERIGHQRDWVWRGWQIRYTYIRNKEKQNPPLILVHGFGAAIEHWRNNIPVLREKYPVYALDLLGFGASKKAATTYQVELWVEQIHDFWQTFIGEPVVLIGNSIGSLVCLMAAVKYPEMVKAIAMLSLPDTSVRQEMMPQWLQPIVKTIEGIVASPALLHLLFRFVRRRSVIRPWVGLAYVDQRAITEELVEIIAAPAYDQGAGRAFISLFQSLSDAQFAPPVKELLPQLSIPSLLLWGKSDRLIPPSLAPKFAQLNPHLQLIEVENAGHCIHDEYPEQFNQIILKWLSVVLCI